MNRRNFLSTALGVPALAAMAGSLSTLLAACGDDEAATEPSYADGPNDVVLSIRYEGGFVPMGFAFVNTPTLLVSGDGRVFEPGMQTLEFPGPLLSPVMVRPISAAGIRKVIRLAGDAGLLAAPPDYSLPGGMMVADAPTTVVTITVGGQTYRHAAEALGLGIGDGTSTPARDNLAAFVEVMTDITAVAGNGKVVRAGWNGGYGRMVEIAHADGYSTRYAHMSKLSVSKGDVVTKGTILGRSGNSGRSTGPHLHYEVRRDGRPVNPLQYIRAGKTIADAL